MSSEEPEAVVGPEEAPPSGGENVPEPPDVEEPISTPSEEISAEEEYEELVEPEKPKKPRKKMKHLGAIVTVIIILMILVAWTALSPRVMPAQGTTYVNSSTYANLGSFNETLKSWAATTNWGISVSGPENASAGATITLLVLISKVSEQSSNFWFTGTAITITNMTVMNENGVMLATMSSKSDLGFGKTATLRLSIADAGNHTLKITGQFLVYVDMRIGFLPVEKINLEPFSLKAIKVS